MVYIKWLCKVASDIYNGRVYDFTIAPDGEAQVEIIDVRSGYLSGYEMLRGYNNARDVYERMLEFIGEDLQYVDDEDFTVRICVSDKCVTVKLCEDGYRIDGKKVEWEDLVKKIEKMIKSVFELVKPS